MTEQPTAPTIDESRARAQALALLGRAHSARANVEHAVSQAAGTTAQGRLAGIVAQLAAAEIQITLSVDGPAGAPGHTELAALKAILEGTERAADAAIQAADTENAAAAADDMATVTAATRREVQSLSRDLFERRIFDPYLHFDSPEEKARYEADQAERQRQIAAALAEHTPGGDLRAGGLTAGGMLEAAGHGATASPDFLPRWNKLVAQLRAQEKAAAVTSPQQVERCRELLREDIRECLNNRGIPQDQIERVLASADPLSAVTPYLNDHLVNELQAATEQALKSAAEPSHPWAAQYPAPAKPNAANARADNTPPPPPVVAMAADIVAQAGSLSSCDGLMITSASGEEGHGLPARSPSPAAPPRGRTPS